MERDVVSKVAAKHRKLLTMEQEAQNLEQSILLSSHSPSQLQKKGLALLGLTVIGSSIGLGGKVIVEFARFSGEPLGAIHSFRVGDVVKLEQGNTSDKLETGDQRISGVVCRVKDAEISVAFEAEIPHGWESKLRIIKLVNQVSMQRMFEALKLLEEAAKSGHGLVMTIFSSSSTIQESNNNQNVKLYNAHLNESQIAAVKSCLSAQHIALVHGPPGTGKTETLVEIIRQTAQPSYKSSSNLKPKRVLVCGPSNLSVDNLVERLGNSKDVPLKIVRLGHPARLMESVQKHSLDLVLSIQDTNQLARECKRELEAAIKNISKVKGYSERRQAFRELSELRKEFRKLEARAIDELLKDSDVILCTLNLAGSRLMVERHFDVCIIDEASQAVEAECWLAALKAGKLIMAGDHLQLPPTITSEKAAEAGLSVTLFARLAAKFGCSLLTTQYRMNEIIMKWASTEFYESKLIADLSVRDHLLADLDGVEKTEETLSPLWYIDTSGSCAEAEETIEDSTLNSGKSLAHVPSKYNQGEAELTISHVVKLLDAGIKAPSIAVITPYSAQVALIASSWAALGRKESIEIGTVDGFQGREKEAIILSMVRSNEQGEIGFLSEIRRTNVAITRARRHVCIIGDSETLGRHSFYKRLVRKCSLLCNCLAID